MDGGVQAVIEKSIIEISNLEHLSEEKKAEIFQQAYETVMNRVMLRIADALEENEIDELKKLFEDGDGANIEVFLASRQIDIEQIAATETLAYKAEMAELMDAINPARSK